ncbi:Cold-regulated protein 28 [Sesamum angolense]|uniref:Cold-regulated protein 28 n=1 Tax=Sesamum angolense TaxID=2727404 RepID=A0AAE1WY93_9LAMI|nr:Cold-regulated protein 28 [Sesamum angolense]
MEGNLRPGTPHPLPAGNVGRDYELTRSNSDASVLTAENCKDILCRSANVVPNYADHLSQLLGRMASGLDDCSAWTDEKHNLYLHRLEVSFVEQLKQSKNLLAQFLVENQRHTNISEKQLTNMSNAFEKFNVLWNGGWQKINCVIGEPFSSSVSADSRTPIKSKGICNFKHMRVRYPPSSAEMPEFLKLCSREKHGKRIISHGFLTCSQQFSSGSSFGSFPFDFGNSLMEKMSYLDIYVSESMKFIISIVSTSNVSDKLVREVYLFMPSASSIPKKRRRIWNLKVEELKQCLWHLLAKTNSVYRGHPFSFDQIIHIIAFSAEGMGQNFLDEDKQNISNSGSRAKRLRTISANSYSQDQIVPSRKWPTADYSVINSTTLGEELARHESASGKY